MKIALIGYGAMGQRVRVISEKRGHEVVAIIDTNSSDATANNINSDSLNSANVAIDFSHPDSTLENIRKTTESGVNMVVGTTGWYNNLDEAQKIVEQSNIGLLWSSNFSIGVNVYFKIMEYTAKLINQFDEYDIWGNEIHHHNKSDSPSGTAKTLEKILLDNIDRKTTVIEDKLDRKIEPNEIHFSSTRGGPVNFSHTIGFDSAADTISITHTARNRDGYVLGAVKAAEWLNEKTGFYGMEDFLTL